MEPNERFGEIHEINNKQKQMSEMCSCSPSHAWRVLLYCNLCDNEQVYRYHRDLTKEVLRQLIIQCGNIGIYMPERIMVILEKSEDK